MSHGLKSGRLKQPITAIAMVLVALALPPVALAVVDTDGDGVMDGVDNCIAVANAPQRDTDGDGIGNFCDGDFNQDCIVNPIDLGIFRSVFFSSDPDGDLNGDGQVNPVDLGLFRLLFFAPPGPSGVANPCSTSLTISGVVTDLPIVFASVTAQVNGTAAGGGVVDLNTTAEVDGSYMLDLVAPSADDFVTLTGQGTFPGQEFVLLKSLAGSVGTLAAAGDNDGTVTSAEAGTLDVTHISTALAVLAERENGGPILTDAALMTATAGVDAAELTTFAAILKTVIDNPQVSLPAGVSDTLALLQDAEETANFLSFLQTNFASEFAAAVAATASAYQVAFASVPDSLYFTLAKNYGVNNVGRAIHFVNDGTATYRGLPGDVAATWVIDANGSIVVTIPAEFLVAVSFPTIEDPNNPGQFIQAEQRKYLEQVTIQRFLDGDLTDSVYVLDRIRENFPDYPQIPDAFVDDVVSASTARLAVDQDQSIPFDGASLVATSRVANFYHQDNAAETALDPQKGFDTLDFNANGTGTTRRRGLTFTWQIGTNGELELDFTNGDTATFRALLDENDFALNTIATSTLAGGTVTRTYRTLMVERDESLTFAPADVTDKRFRSSLIEAVTISPATNPFDFNLLAGGDACRNPGSGSTEWGWSLIDSRVEILRTVIASGNPFFYRVWEPIQRDGDTFWLIEMLQLPFGNPAIPLVDPAVTPGRLLPYVREQDLIGNLAATINDDAFAIEQDTPLNILFSDLFGNDTDPEDDTLFIMGADSTGSLGGTIEFLNDSSGFNVVGLRYTPPNGATGVVETFTYQASDIACPLPNGDTATVSITIN